MTIELMETRLVPSFVAPRSYDTGRNPQGVVVADFNGDGVPDLAVANSGDSYAGDPGSVSVLLGNGDGSFQPPRAFAAGIAPRG